MMPPPVRCRAARMCHAVAHGGQIAVPLDIAQQFVQHCTGAPAAFTEDTLAGSLDALHLQPHPQPLESVLSMRSSPLSDIGELAAPQPAEGGPQVTARAVRASRLSRHSRFSSSQKQDPDWSQRASGGCCQGADGPQAPEQGVHGAWRSGSVHMRT